MPRAPAQVSGRDNPSDDRNWCLNANRFANRGDETYLAPVGKGTDPRRQAPPANLALLPAVVILLAGLLTSLGASTPPSGPGPPRPRSARPLHRAGRTPPRRRAWPRAGRQVRGRRDGHVCCGRGHGPGGSAAPDRRDHPRRRGGRLRLLVVGPQDNRQGNGGASRTPEPSPRVMRSLREPCLPGARSGGSKAVHGGASGAGRDQWRAASFGPVPEVPTTGGVAPVGVRAYGRLCYLGH